MAREYVNIYNKVFISLYNVNNTAPSSNQGVEIGFRESWNILIGLFLNQLALKKRGEIGMEG